MHRNQAKPSRLVEMVKRIRCTGSEALKGLALVFYNTIITEVGLVKAPTRPHDTVEVTLTGDWIVKIAILSLSISLIGRKFGIAITPFHLLYSFGLATLIVLAWKSFRRR